MFSHYKLVAALVGRHGKHCPGNLEVCCCCVVSYLINTFASLHVSSAPLFVLNITPSFCFLSHPTRHLAPLVSSSSQALHPFLSTSSLTSRFPHVSCSNQVLSLGKRQVWEIKRTQGRLQWDRKDILTPPSYFRKLLLAIKGKLTLWIQWCVKLWFAYYWIELILIVQLMANGYFQTVEYFFAGPLFIYLISNYWNSSGIDQ